ncbi:response regulator [Pararhizobium arenae]|uniref:response regulator n=1 Tax=Pararhizobium arenae TaxID=1856850 RepID=UPI00094AEC81|nr:response regulator [Pararhizobium arenae]
MDVFEKQRVLIAEDEGLILIAVEQMVEDAGFIVVSVTNGDDAVRELERDDANFSALITDIRMPGKGSGWDVARRARQISPTLPVVYMTGDSASEWAAQGVPNSTLLQKPFAEAQLVTALSLLLNQVPPTGDNTV